MLYVVSIFVLFVPMLYERSLGDKSAVLGTSAWWAKYPNPDQPHVKRLDTVYRNIDKDNQVS